MLYLCATPIGNLEDMTFRVINILKSVDLIAAEDTRNSIKLLNHFDIHTPMTAYHEFNKIEKGKELVDFMLNGKSVALITDAGMPGISDPGEELVKMSRAAGIDVTIAPGACAAVSALAISALSTRRFSFEGFLPVDKKEQRRVLDEMKNETRTMIVYEAPHRLLKTLELLMTELGDREMSVVKELTKKHENTYTGTIQKHIAYFTENEPKGEYVLVIKGKDVSEIEKENAAKWETMTIPEHVKMYIEQGIDKKEAMRMAARDRGVSKRDIYNAMLDE